MLGKYKASTLLYADALMIAERLWSGLLVGLNYSSRIGRFIVSFVLGVLSGSFIFTSPMSSAFIVRDALAS